MTFLAPTRLLLLAVPVALVAVYLLAQHRRRRYAVRFANLDLLASVAPRRAGWRRHLPAAVAAAAVVVLVGSLARPAREEKVPRETATVMLVVDTSASMDATDVAPSRLAAAKTAAQQFVDGLPDRLRLGLVTYDRSPRLIASPTADHVAVTEGIARMTTGPGTATGEAIMVALDAIDTVAAAGADDADDADDGDDGGTDDDDGGERVAAIVVLSDGVTTVGRPAEDAAAAAAAKGVPVTTIAFGTPTGTVEVGGQSIPVPSDPLAMSAVAQATGGSFFEAFTGEELRSVYDDIGSRVGFRIEQREISLVFAGLALVLLVVAVAGSLLWTGRLL